MEATWNITRWAPGPEGEWDRAACRCGAHPAMLEAPGAFQVSCPACGRMGPQSRSQAAAARAWRADIVGFPVTCDPLNLVQIAMPEEIPASMLPEGAYCRIKAAEDGRIWLEGPVEAVTHIAGGRVRGPL